MKATPKEHPGHVSASSLLKVLKDSLDQLNRALQVSTLMDGGVNGEVPRVIAILVVILNLVIWRSGDGRGDGNGDGGVNGDSGSGGGDCTRVEWNEDDGGGGE